jgi:3' terminal RNA ribose 2'-O-methyltransferase Hen1
MLLTISTTHSPATDLGYLLHKHPQRCQSFPMTFGQAFVFYPEASAEKCTVALLLEIDPIGLVRGKSGSGQPERSLEQYVNDRPYVASSFLSVAISKVFGTALAGNCKDLPDLVNTPLPFTVGLPVLPCRGGEAFLRQLFEPLGYQVEAEPIALDQQFPDWGDSIYVSVTLQNTLRLSDLLSHLYVLIPVLDDDKHYWVGDDEVDKLLRHGAGWLPQHEAKQKISDRYLKHQGYLTRRAMAQLNEDLSADLDQTPEIQSQEEAALEERLSLNQQRLTAIVALLKQRGSKRVIDLGCGEGKLLRSLLKDACFEQITGIDVSPRALEIAQKRLDIDHLPSHQASRLQLLSGALTYRDDRLSGYDAATLIEVIEHVELDRLPSLERVVFEFAHPQVVIVTTPNSEYNVRFENLPAGKLRHRDHRFEWTRLEFQTWGDRVADRFGYSVEFDGIGLEDPELGAPTQMGVFSR